MRKENPKFRGDIVTIHYLDCVIVFKSITEMAKNLSMTASRLRKLLGDKRDIPSEMWEELVRKSYDPPRRGCLPGEVRRRKK